MIQIEDQFEDIAKLEQVILDLQNEQHKLKQQISLNTQCQQNFETLQNIDFNQQSSQILSNNFSLPTEEVQLQTLYHQKITNLQEQIQQLKKNNQQICLEILNSCTNNDDLQALRSQLLLLETQNLQPLSLSQNLQSSSSSFYNPSEDILELQSLAKYQAIMIDQLSKISSLSNQSTNSSPLPNYSTNSIESEISSIKSSISEMKNLKQSLQVMNSQLHQEFEEINNEITNPEANIYISNLIQTIKDIDSELISAQKLYNSQNEKILQIREEKKQLKKHFEISLQNISKSNESYLSDRKAALEQKLEVINFQLHNLSIIPNKQSISVASLKLQARDKENEMKRKNHINNILTFLSVTSLIIALAFISMNNYYQI